jgi:hypothetical protein
MDKQIPTPAFGGVAPPLKTEGAHASMNNQIPFRGVKSIPATPSGNVVLPKSGRVSPTNAANYAASSSLTGGGEAGGGLFAGNLSL